MSEKRCAKIPAEKFRFIQMDTQLRDVLEPEASKGYFRDAVARLCRNKASVLAFAIICVIVVLALFGPLASGYGYNDQNPSQANLPPRIPGLEQLGICDGSEVYQNRRVADLGDTEKYPEGSVLGVENQRTVRDVEMADVRVNAYVMAGAGDEYHWFGTDYLGRDLFTRLCRGARVSLLIALLAVSSNIVFGIVYGAVAGYYGGKLDLWMMRVTEVIGAFPQVVVATLFILFFGTGIFSIAMALVIRGWIPVARIVRSQFYRFRNREYVLAARTLGVPDRVLIFRHILPNSVGPIITKAMIDVPAAIFSESFLAYIGLGLQAPEPSIGVLLSEGQKVLMHYPYQTLFPALMISVLMISFNLFANGLRDALDPTTRGQE